MGEVKYIKKNVTTLWDSVQVLLLNTELITAVLLFKVKLGSFKGEEKMRSCFPPKRDSTADRSSLAPDLIIRQEEDEPKHKQRVFRKQEKTIPLVGAALPWPLECCSFFYGWSVCGALMLLQTWQWEL